MGVGCLRGVRVAEVEQRVEERLPDALVVARAEVRALQAPERRATERGLQERTWRRGGNNNEGTAVSLRGSELTSRGDVLCTRTEGTLNPKWKGAPPSCSC